MREIKFRGKRKDNWGWSRGHLWTRATDGAYMVEGHEVHPETVGQFTGLLDKNKKEIYEGDIAISGTEEIYRDVCEWSDESSMFMWVSLPDRDITEYLNEYEVTIIGNIHENPELLEKAK